MKRCCVCEDLKALTEFSKDRTAKDGLSYKCKICARAGTAKWRKENPNAHRQYLADYRKSPENRKRHTFNARKWYARTAGQEFTITFAEIEWPELCPVLGVPLNYSADRPSNRDELAPSLDRFDSSKGYVSGNVYVISWRANRIKNDGTADEHQRIAAWMHRIEASL